MIERATIHFLLAASLLLPTTVKSDTFSVVVMTDSQFYAERHPEIMEAQIDWIVANRVTENIIYVAQTGDLKDDQFCDDKPVNVGTGAGRTEWQIADDAYGDLDTANIPYAVLPGNHDFDPVGGFCPSGANARPLSVYNTRFGPARFAGDSFYGDPLMNRPGNRSAGSNEDNFTLFDSNGIEFISINLAYRPAPNATAVGDPELAWADNLLKTYPNRLGIVTSHYFLNTNDGLSAPNGPYGQAVYDALSDNPNLFMMLSGHWYGEAWVTESTDRTGMQPVQILMANYQAMEFPDDGDPNTPPNTPDPASIDFSGISAPRAGNGATDAGFMRIMRFDTDTRMVDIETFIPPVVPIKNRTGTLVSTYFPASGANMGENTASNLSISFDGYVPLPPPALTYSGSLANDTFVRFLANRIIPEADVNSRCADGDGCRITLTRVYGTTAPVVFGPTNFFYNPDANQFQIRDAAGNVIRTGINANLQTEAIVGLQANTNCWFSDWDTSGTGSNGDRNGNWSVLIFNNTATNLTCTIRIED